MPEKRIDIIEYRFHQFSGDYPNVDTFENIDVELLTKGDSDPLYVTLPIAEVGRTSINGLVYDDELVTAIETQLREGVIGIRGHLTDEQEETAFPLAAVYWVGAKRDGDTLYGKGYVPPGENKDDIRRRKATNAGIGTSIYGSAVRQAVAESTKYKAKKFKLKTLDFGAPKQVSLGFGKGDFVLTKEMQEAGKAEEGNPMPELLTMADVPEAIREQIIKEAKIKADAAKTAEVTQERDTLREVVSEIEKLFPENTDITKAIKEVATWKNIVGTIRSTIGKDTDTAQIVTEYHTAMTKLAEMLGVPYSNIAVTVEEMHEQIAEFKKENFQRSVSDKVVEFTPWNVKDKEAKERVAKFRANYERAIVAELKGETKPEKVAEVAKKLWDDEYQMMSLGVVNRLSGPPAIVGGKTNEASNGKYRSEEAVAELKKEWAITAPGA